jgi:hypothetical protein
MTLEEKRIYAAKWRAANRDRVNARIRVYKVEWRKRGGDELRAKAREYARQYRAKNPEKCRALDTASRRRNAEKHRALDRQWKKKNRGKVRLWRVAKKYGLSPEAYLGMFAAQGNACAICREPELRRTLCVDHDHKTGRVRGLLCTWCNMIIGTAKDSQTRLRAAVWYLETA